MMTRRQWLWVFGACTLGFTIATGILDTRMTDTGGPGILGLQIAGSADNAAEILRDWGDKGQDAARLSLWIDFGYLIAYAGLLVLAVRAVRDGAAAAGREGFARFGSIVQYLPVQAAFCDAVEDVLLLRILDGAEGGTALAATCFAVVKFLGLAVTIGYLLVALRHRRG